MEVDTASWYVWTYDSTRSEAKRSRFRHVTFSRFPHGRLWTKDLVVDVAKTGRFRYDIKTPVFFVLMFLTNSSDRYSQGELRGVFKVRIHNHGDFEDVEIVSASFGGPDGKFRMYDWQMGEDPWKFPEPPPLAPAPPDITKGPMFGGGIVHHMYPRVVHPSYMRREHMPGHRQYAKVATKSYAHLQTQTRKMGLPSALPSFSSVDRSRQKRAGRLRKITPSY
ncbi:MAG: hypothetical protein JRN20_02320 [Nitrososphaerota archaeon]|nr:hypothetical protein [Nitrososphaerota archaeon]MDG6923971.1 hypothetical protein [Nitrososphaerota archaeon]